MMRRLPLLLLLIAPLALSACVADLAVPGDVQIRCTSDADCPAPLVCVARTERCIGAERLNEEPIDVVDATLARPVMSRASGFDANELTVTLSAAPDSLVVTLDDAPVACVPSVAGAFTFSCPFTTPAPGDGAADDGAGRVVVLAKDALGTEATAVRFVAYDLAPPAFVVDPVLTIEAEPGNPRDGPPTALRAGGLVTVTFAVDEPAIALAVATSDGAPAASIDGDVVTTGIAMVVTHVVGAGDADGTYRFALTLTDAVGNATPALDVAVPFVIDQTAPAPPAVDVAGTVTLERAPWGAVRFDDAGAFVEARSPSTRVTGLPASVEGAAELEVRALDGARLTAPGAAAGADGAFQVQLVVSDARDVVVVVRDGAGNESPPARVRDLEWIAGAGGKIAGSNIENPHAFLQTQRLAGQLVDDTAREPVEPALLAAADGAGPITSVRLDWREEPNADSPLPEARFDACMVYDAARGRLVMASGSFGANDVDASTWELVGDLWQEVASPVPLRPAARRGCAWDQRRALTVTVDEFEVQEYAGAGGLGGGGVGGGGSTSWIARAAPGEPGVDVPTARIGAAVAYDESSGAVVRFGGLEVDGAGAVVDETWQWDGAAFTRLALPPSPSPPARWKASLAWDEQRGALVLFGGFSDPEQTAPLADTWLFAGGAWSELVDVGAPPARGSAGLCRHPDAGGGGLLLYGGDDGTFAAVALRDIWQLAVDGWSEMTPAAGEARPSASSGAAVAYDAGRDRVVLFGGNLSRIVPTTDETWSYDGERWRNLTGNPPLARNAAVTASAADGRLLLAGGFQPSFGGLSVSISDVIARFDGTQWTIDDTSALAVRPPASPLLLACAGPAGAVVVDGNDGGVYVDGGGAADWTLLAGAAPAGLGACAFDAADGEIVLVSGARTFVSTGGAFGAPVCDPDDGDACPDGIEAVMAYDAVDDVVVLVREGTSAGETWEWDGAAWTLLPQPTPFVRGMSLAFHERRQRLVMFGGDFAAETWELDDVAGWTLLPVGTAPPARSGHAMGAIDGTVVVHGGSVNVGGAAIVSDTWLLDDVDARPALLAQLVVATAGIRDTATLQSLVVDARAFTGGPAGEPAGFDVLVWDGERYVVRGGADADDGDGGAGLVGAHARARVDDPTVLARARAGAAQIVGIAVAPRARGVRAGDAAFLGADFVQLTVRYRE